jgi:UDP-N-acetyl-2-amino-2-deoxyglucuronate dehydrogenase
LSNLKFALIGCGRIAQRHAEQIHKNGKLIAVCDIDLTKAVALGKKYKATAYSDIDELLRKEKHIEVVAICTPNGLHAEHTIKALKKGLHVVCEKPMAISVLDCGAMIQEADKANRRLFIVKQNRFNPHVVAVKKLIDEGKLGKVFNVQLNCFWNRNENYYKDSDWKGTLKLDGGILYTQFSHFIDILYWMIGDVREVRAYKNNFLHKDITEFEDTGVVILKFFNNALGTINFTTNSFQQNMEGSITIFGEKGTVKIGGQYLNELDYQLIEDVEIPPLPKSNPPNYYGQYFGSMSNHDQVYENVVEVLLRNGVIATNGLEGLKTVEIIDKIYEASMKQN